MTRFILPASLILLAFVGCQYSAKQPAPAPIAAEVPTPTPATARVPLTYANAQAAVQAWIADMMQGGSVVVVRLKRIPRQHSAEARLRFTNLRYINEDFRQVSYTGKGLAVFTYDIDGRWVLMLVATLNGLHSIIQNTLTEVKSSL
jgi:hypothetical protein